MTANEFVEMKTGLSAAAITARLNRVLPLSVILSWLDEYKTIETTALADLPDQSIIATDAYPISLANATTYKLAEAFKAIRGAAILGKYETRPVFLDTTDVSELETEYGYTVTAVTEVGDGNLYVISWESSGI
jgi:hypothetical protein